MIIKFAKDCWSVLFKDWKSVSTLWLVLFIPTFLFFYGRHQAKEDILRERRVREQILEDRKEAKAEARRRIAEKSDRSPDPSVRVAPTVRPVLQNRPTREMAEQQPGEALSVLEAAQAAKRQHASETLVAAKKRIEWERRRDALKKRFLENSRKVRASARATIASADAELEAMLSLFKLMSPEQLEYARQEALKTLPAEKVESFFDDLANHGTTKTPEQLTKDAQDILKSREAQRIIDREIEVESQQIALEEEELKRTEPPIPW